MRFFSSKRTRQTAVGGNELTPLPEGVDDNKYLAASANAAVVDKDSGAYDRHLFGEREIPAMPYEKAVDQHLELMSLRLGQKFIRHISRARKTLINATAKRDRLNLKQGLYASKVEKFRLQLAEQRSILDGSKTGAHGLFWPGHASDFLGRASAVIKLITKPAIFVLVGFVDLAIIFLSFQNLAFSVTESIALTIPAVGAQLAFPHLAGGRIRLLMRLGQGANRRRWSYAIEATVMLGIWLLFVYTIASIRLKYILDSANIEGIALSPTDIVVFFLISVVLIVTLGGWLFFLSVRENEHEVSALRLNLSLHKMDLATLRLEKRVSKLDQRASIANESLNAFLEEQENALKASRFSLGEAAKAVYRRALINQEGDPEFTSSYFGAPKNLDR